MPKVLISGGTVVDPSQGLNGKHDVLIEGGRVMDIQRTIPRGAADRVIEAEGLLVAPGFIDIHTHLREPGGGGAETIESGSAAAAAGGFTTIMCMPNTNPVCDTETGVQYVVSRAASVGGINVIPVACITRGMKGEEITNFGKLLNAGAGAFSDDGRPVMNAEIMRRALEYTRMLGVPIFEHCEDMNLSSNGVMNEGRTSIRLGLKGIPRTSESTMVARNAALAAATGGHIHICHVSTRESVEAIREARRNGVHITAEVSPHHLTMTEEAVIGYDTNAKMKPPLCEAEDRDALIAALVDGTLDCIATDHAPHSANSKENVFDAAPFGIIGMETSFPLLYTEFVATRRWSLEFLIEKMTTGPASVMGAKWGSLRAGSDADVTLIRLGEEYEFTRRHLRSRSVNCPWLGTRMKARVAATLSRGREAFVSPELYPDGLFSAPALTFSATDAGAEPTLKKKTKSKKKKSGKGRD